MMSLHLSILITPLWNQGHHKTWLGGGMRWGKNEGERERIMGIAANRKPRLFILNVVNYNGISSRNVSIQSWGSHDHSSSLTLFITAPLSLSACRVRNGLDVGIRPGHVCYCRTRVQVNSLDLYWTLFKWNQTLVFIRNKFQLQSANTTSRWTCYCCSYKVSFRVRSLHTYSHEISQSDQNLQWQQECIKIHCHTHRV